jgi:hypothetical protein
MLGAASSLGAGLAAGVEGLASKRQEDSLVPAR